MKQDKLKKIVGWAALEYIKPYTIIGIGTGSTINFFIEALSTVKKKIEGVISSSESSSIKLKKIGIPLFDLNDVHSLDIYVDSADEINNHLQMIKGGGAALTKEKIIAAVSKKFICIVDNSKYVDILGHAPIPIEVIPMARALVARELVRFGGLPKYRQGVITVHGNIILDIYNLKIIDAIKLEQDINNIPGVVTVGLFANRNADIALISSETGIKIIN